MADIEAAAERHEDRHRRMETAIAESRLWRTGNGNPHRGAEARILALEEDSVSKDELARMIATAVNSGKTSRIAAWGPTIAAFCALAGVIIVAVLR